MPQTLIVIFLLFFAVLAFGWFYWQRAKARDAAKGSQADQTTTTDQPGA
jgi:predicted negative regulator of RcsB-dependent stress response